MRIMIVGPVFPYRGGIVHYTQGFARALIGVGDEVEILSFRRQYPRWLYPGKSDRDPSQTKFDLQPHYLLDPLYPWTWEQALRAADDFHPQRLVMVWWTTFWGPAYTYLSWRFKKRGLKPIFLIHNIVPHEARPYDRILARLALSQGSGFIVQSERERLKLVSLLPNAAPIMLCRLAAHFPFANSHLGKEEARQALGLSPDLPVVLFFGLVRPYKGLRYLLEAVSILQKERVHTQVLVAGEFWENFASYTRLVAELGLDGKVVMANRYIPDEEVGLYFAAADFFVAPYVDGTQSAALKLAQGYGLPSVVTSAIADGSEQEHMKVIPPADPIALAQAMKEVLQSDLAKVQFKLDSWQPLIDAVHAQA